MSFLDTALLYNLCRPSKHSLATCKTRTTTISRSGRGSLALGEDTNFLPRSSAARSLLPLSLLADGKIRTNNSLSSLATDCERGSNSAFSSCLSALSVLRIQFLSPHRWIFCCCCNTETWKAQIRWRSLQHNTVFPLRDASNFLTRSGRIQASQLQLSLFGLRSSLFTRSRELQQS